MIDRNYTTDSRYITEKNNLEPQFAAKKETKINSHKFHSRYLTEIKQLIVEV